MSIQADIAAKASLGAGPWLLFAELNHRVRNELMVALSALRVARSGCSAGVELVDTLDQAINTLENFGLVQHLLDRYQSHGSLRQRLEALCGAIAQSKGAPNRIQIAISTDEVEADDETTWTLCAVAFELMTNAVRHAFGQSGRSVVGVSLCEAQEWIVLTIADNGSGYATRNIQPIVSDPGLGSTIVAALTERLGGSVSLCTGPTGTTVTVTVPTNRISQWCAKSSCGGAVLDCGDKQ